MQPERHKSKEDTWRTEELKKHLKGMQPESAIDRRHKERRHHREEDREERAQRRHKPDEKIDDRERPKNPERDRHADRERVDNREQRREKEKAREGDKDRHRASERHRTRDREKARDAGKEYATSGLSREERKLRDSLEKSKHRSEDRERRHLERREKGENYEDQKLRRHTEGEEMKNQDADQERRRRERKHKEAAEREKRHHSRRETATHSEQRTNEDSGAYLERTKEKHSSDGDKEQKHRDKKDRRTRAHERKETHSQENISLHKSRYKEAPAKQESGDEKEAEEAPYSTDTANDESTNYEEDFEDYDDDFEDESEEDKVTYKEPEPKAVSRNAEVEQIREAMFLENESISAIPASHGHRACGHQDEEPSDEGRNSTPRRSAQRGVFIDFGSAKQHQVNGQISNKQKKRSSEILRLVDLDFSSTFSLLDLPPVKEYEMYIRNFGKTNTKQAYVQCNEDAVDREIQTEEIDLEEKWTQHPGEGAAVCGGHTNDAVQETGAGAKVDSQRLTAFLRSACQVISVLLEENLAEKQSNFKVQSKDPCLSISESCFHLNTNLPFLQGRSAHQLQFSEAQRHLLLTVHGAGRGAESTSLWEKSIICLWNIWQPSTPQQILICESEVTCCCFSPGMASLVFAGTVDGSLLVWDLREDISMHQTVMIENTNWTFRSSTFSTGGLFAPVSHTHPVRAVEPVPSTETKDHGISSLSSPEALSGLSFQVASLDESGHLIFWVVVELRRADLAGSQSDLGLIPGGEVKLVRSSSLRLSDKFYHKDVLTLGSPKTLNMKFLPRDFNHFVIGTNIGLVTHGTRYGLIKPPLQYASPLSKLRPAQVTAIDFSPFGVSAFLAGCSDGSIRLHTMSTELPAMQWNDSTDGRPIAALQWSLTRPTVFLVLDAASSIYIWDLSQDDLHPIAKDSITSDRVLSMSVFGEPEKNNNITGLGLGKSSGEVEIQYLKKKIAKIQPQELETLQLIFHRML